MTIKEYIETRFSIDELVASKVGNPVERVLNNDSLPYDDIIYIDGALQKVVEINDSEVITVIELLSYTKDDISKMNNDIADAYRAYMSLVTVDENDFDILVGLSREYMDNKAKKQELIAKCTQ